MARSIVRKAVRLFSVLLAVSVVLAQAPRALADGLPSNLDLTSTAKSASAGNSSQVMILAGGRPQMVSPGASVTPAQAVAVSQVLSSGTQSLVLGALGNATGGSLTFSAQQLSSVNVPSGVRAIANFTGGAPLSVLGNLVNSGNFYAVSTSSAVTTANISAMTIANNTGALLSTLLPVGGLPGFSDAINNLGLSLSASNLVNQGVISSAADLSIAAPNVINHGGTLAAPNGAINLTLPGGVKGTTLAVLGGDLAAQQVNVDAGCGHLDMNVMTVQGLLNVTAGSAYTGAHGGALSLGNINITGDPTFYNNGTLTVNGSITVGEKLALLATGDVLLNGNTITVRDGGTGQGFDVTIVAGGALTPSAGAVGQTSPTVGPFTFPPPVGTGTPIGPGQTVKVSSPGPTGTGGSITCNACTIDAGSTSGTFNGGNILMAAYSGTVGLTGQINLAGLSSVVTNSVGGKAGNVTFIAPGDISFRLVNFSNTGGGVNPGGGTFTITTAQPTGSMTLNEFGAATGALKPGALTPGNIFMTSAAIGTSGGSAIWKAGGDINFTDAAATEINVSSGSAAGGFGGTINLSAGGNLILAGSLAANGGTGSGGINGANPGDSGTAGGAGGKAGTITLTGVTISNQPNFPVSISANGGSGGPGGMGVAGNATTISGGAGGNGGAGGVAGVVTVKGTTVDLTGSAVFANGGSGGVGGDGQNGFSFLASNGGNGGNAGNGGASQKGGIVSITATTNVTAPAIQANGGDGGSAGDAGTGGNGGLGITPNELALGGNPGAAGTPSNGGLGGTVTITGGKLNGNTASMSGDITVYGGMGGDAGAGGGGGGGHKSGKTGTASKDAGDGGKGGAITVTAAGVTYGNPFFIVALSADGGSGGAGANGGAGGACFEGSGAKGADAGDSGSGGQGGTVKISASLQNFQGNGSTDLTISANGGQVGNGGHTGGAGGFGGKNGGVGGKGGDVGNGGAGGAIALSAPKGNLNTGVNFTGVISANGGQAFLSGAGDGGTGGDGSSGAPVSTGSGGDGGKGGLGGNGGNAGSVTVTALSIDANSDIQAIGGSSSGAGNGGTGGGLPFDGPKAGNGGSAQNGGVGGKGGSVSVAATGAVTLGDVNVSAGAGGAGGFGGSAGIVGLGVNGSGGNGGNGGNGGASGAGGSMKISSKGLMVALGTLVANGTDFLVAIGGGEAGGGGTAGTGGIIGNGGNGGNAGIGGGGGKAGSISISSVGGFIMSSTPNTGMHADGGYGGDGASGGDGGFGNGAGSIGGSGGKAGGSGAGGAGGTIALKDSTTGLPATIQVDAGTNVSANGGDGGDVTANAGIGRNGVAAGGKGGDMQKAGSGGAGGKISITIAAPAGGVSLTNDFDAFGGNGGDVAAAAGAGGSATGTAGNGGNGGVSASAGAGGAGGAILFSGGAAVFATGLNPWNANVNGGDAGVVRGRGGDGGNSGTVSGKGGAGGFGAIGSPGGKAGTITVFGGFGVSNVGTSVLDANGGFGSQCGLAVNFPGGNGGSGQDGGGKGGDSMSGGAGGAGGKITITGGDLFQMGAMNAVGGVGGGGIFRAGNAGNAVASGVGAAGGIGRNAGAGGAGGAITLKATTKTGANGGIDVLNSLSATGGNGGNLDLNIFQSGGGDGGNGFAGGGAGGAGGSAGAGGKGGVISLTAANNTAGAPAISLATTVSVAGGFGGDTEGLGGAGGFATNIAVAGPHGPGGAGGKAGAAGAGGAGGAISGTTASGDILTGNVFAFGGSGGGALTNSTGGTGGTAQGGGPGGAGGAGASGGAGGAGGSITFKSTNSAIPGDLSFFANLNNFGGDGGQAGGTAGFGGGSNALPGIAGKGGDAGDGGNGGAGGKTLVSSAGAGVVTLFSGANPFGGTGGGVANISGAGSNGFNTGGASGAGGSGGNGGAGGSFIASTGTGNMTFTTINVNGGNGGFPTEAGPPGTGSGTGTGGAAGANGNGGSGGKGGTIKLATTGTLNYISLLANGGSGQNAVANGTQGGACVGCTGGTGGYGGDGGNAGSGGTIIRSSPGGPAPQANPGTFGTGGTGGLGGTGTTTGAAGANGKNGKPGANGTIVLMDEDEDMPGQSKKNKKRIAQNVDDASHLKPVAFVQPTLLMHDQMFSAANTLVAPVAKSQVAVAGNVRVHVAKGAVAFVVNNGSETAILALHESAQGDVGVLVDGREVHLRAGQQLVITEKTNASFAATNPLTAIAIRGVSQHEIAGSTRAFTCDFSIPSALTALPALRELPRATFEKVLKNAAALQMLSARKGAYKVMQKGV